MHKNVDFFHISPTVKESISTSTYVGLDTKYEEICISKVPTSHQDKVIIGEEKFYNCGCRIMHIILW
jgi:hypothetical protein